MTKPEYEPLLSAGFHDIDLDSLDNLFVDNFANNTRRIHLVSQLKIFLKELSKVNAKFEIWLDGSFLTLKDEPVDIDLLIVYDKNQMNALSVDEKKLINSLFHRATTKIRYDLDILLCPNDDLNNRSYWRGWFGFTRNEVPKGIARFEYGVN
jgi:hypothetical protein